MAVACSAERASALHSQPGSSLAGEQRGPSWTVGMASTSMVWEALDGSTLAGRSCSAGWHAFLGSPPVLMAHAALP